MCRLENIVKKHDEFKLSVDKSKEEADHGSGGTAYTAVLVALFVAAPVLVCFKFFREGIVGMGSSKLITMEVSTSCSTAFCPAFL
jgi:hypothetical protein